MPKIVAQIKMRQEIVGKIQTEESAVNALRDILFEFGLPMGSEKYELSESNAYYEEYEKSETELDKLSKKDKIPLRWKVDPMISQDFPTSEPTGSVYGVNNAHFALVESDGIEYAKKAWKATIVSVQLDFKLERSLRNHRLLSKHFISIFRGFFSNSKVDQFLDGFKDQRCHLLAFTLVWWELYALFTPEQIKIDIFDLLCSRGGACFQTYCTPCGLLQTDRKEFRCNFMTKRHSNSQLYVSDQVSEAYKRFRTFYHVHPKNEGRVAKSDHDRHT